MTASRKIISGKSAGQRGFTLVELIVCVVIIAILSAVGLPVLSAARKNAAKAEEVAGAKQLIAGYLLYAGENDGRVLPGYVEANDVKDNNGQAVHHPASTRYPWRLAPYLNMNLKGSAYVNGQKKKFDTDGSYAASTFPSLGLNIAFVGGDFKEAGDLPLSETVEKRYGIYCVKRLSDALAPSSLIVFASARGPSADNVITEGFHMVQAPNLTAKLWPDKYDEKLNPKQFGYVHPRFSGKAVTVMLDGHVAVLNFEELKDMRRWSNQAYEQDNPNFVLQRQ